MNVHVLQVEPAGSVAIGTGLDDDGKTVRFGGDWRPMADIAQALEAGEDVEVELEGWQILG